MEQPPLLQAKLHIPSVRTELVSRPRLIERLNAGLGRKLTLLSAPAGFGKTTLASEWIALCGRPVAWLSLDKGDNHPARFLTYLIAALQTIAPAMGARALAVLHSPQPPPTESILTALLNEMMTVAPSFVLVLDDYHVIEDPTIGAALTFLLDHLPPPMHLVIATRENPALPLARYRVRGELTEVRAADLRFTPEEAAEFLNQVMGLDLSAEDIAALETRTEGWIAGLQLAALALQGAAALPGHKAASIFIESFTGSHHFVLDYLVGEVLHQQTESVQTFLLHTSILERLTASLCEAVWMNPEAAEVALPPAPSPLASQSILEYLEGANLFLAPLDNERRYYRYHHLFSDMLRHRLRRTYPARLPHLHARAAAWFEAQGDASEAFEHWIAAGDHQKAAQVVEKYGYQHFEKADFQQLAAWLQQIPPELIQARPWLCIFHSWGLIFTGQYEAAARHLTLAEQTLGPISESSDPEDRDQYGHVAASRAFLASRSQDGEGIIHYGSLASKYVAPAKRAMRGYIAFFLGTGRYKEDQYSQAQASWREAARLNKEAGNLLIAVNSLVALAELHRIQGKLHASWRVCQETAGLAIDAWDNPLPVAAEVYVARARLHYEWNDFESAEADFARAATLMEQYPSFDLKVEYNTWLSILRLAQGDPESAAALIHEIEASDRQSFYKSAAAFLACRLNYYLAVGDLARVNQILSQ
ncbi:MAG: LuxR family transcriptional regulator, partial [Anaerolineae bacterium]|nr:LuxR family transcriptional regulator [Anaerolineae bacterium]